MNYEIKEISSIVIDSRNGGWSIVRMWDETGRD